ncbi:hypothetical protein HELRODRAFT_83483 [Helobdella robusta]|uniref:EF-hand domain-containing protein n=1 Tax=Helobdella robusta TaxID=6412 RepID=T1G561_HELRO|nr:hypothetical protein HELRODRAFT_83483 [Helobdella robusta]ESO00094.1 hypothetical protein HELRODRAFT_83483 [Helobdella robusta]
MARKFVEVDLNADIREAFKIFDRDGSGLIHADEFKAIMMSCGEKLTETEVDEMMKEADINGDGAIDYEGNGTVDFMEFIRLMARKFVEVDLNADIREAFKIFDRDGSGLIHADEFKAIMMSCGEKLTETEVDEMMKEADINGDGAIDYEGL